MWAGRQCYVTAHPSGVDGITKRRSGGGGGGVWCVLAGCCGWFGGCGRGHNVTSPIDSMVVGGVTR